jgi:hypothetical protein
MKFKVSKRHENKIPYLAADLEKEQIRSRKLKYPSRRDASRYRVEDPSAVLTVESSTSNLSKTHLPKFSNENMFPDPELTSSLQIAASYLFSHPGHPHPYLSLTGTALLTLGKL